MAAAIRSMIGKVGNTRSVRNDVTSFPISNPHLHLGYSSRHPLDLFPVVHHPRNQRLPKKSEPDNRPVLSMTPPEIAQEVINAHFALEEFNKQKNAQLQFVRVVKAYNQECGGAFNHLMLTLEAIDADNVIRIYQAIVKQFWIAKRPLLLLLFGLVAENGNGD
ncbi:hypothetical protein ACLB2K_021372 [Fragaria x ananassa]